MRQIIYFSTLFLLLTVTSYAQWTNDPTLTMALSDTGANGSHLNPKSVSDGKGGAIITLVNEEKPAEVMRLSLPPKANPPSGGDAINLSSGVSFLDC